MSRYVIKMPPASVPQRKRSWLDRLKAWWRGEKRPRAVPPNNICGPTYEFALVDIGQKKYEMVMARFDWVDGLFYIRYIARHLWVQIPFTPVALAHYNKSMVLNALRLAAFNRRTFGPSRRLPG